MSAESTNVSSDATAAKRPEQRILLHLPDLAAGPISQPLPAALSRSSQARTRGMEVLQRVLSRRSGLFGLSGLFSGLTGPNRWQNRLWLATLSLIGISCLTLAMGMRQSSKEKHSAVTADPTLVEEFENDLDRDDGKVEVRHAVAYHANYDRGEAPTGTPGAGVIQPVAYETPQAAAPRGAWLEGTIIPDESE